MDFLKKTAKKAFQYEAKLILKKYRPKIIAITGSVGKTLTREAIYLVLSKKYFVRKNGRSFTTDFGIPLTIIGCPEGKITAFQLLKNIFHGLGLLFYKSNYPKWLILEIDGDKPGDLKIVSDYLPIDILVMTAIGEVPSHVESFYDVSNFMAEKKILIKAIKKNGYIVYNADDLQVSSLLQNVEQRKIACGITRDSDISGTPYKILYGNGKSGMVPTGMTFDIINGTNTGTITVFDTLGIQNEYACLLATAIGLEFGINLYEIITCLNKYKSFSGRMKILTGIKETVIIDDSYNASPVAMTEAIMVFAELNCSGRKIAVLGDMLELGKYSADEHRKIASLIKDTANFVICVGLRMRKLTEELLNLGFNEMNILSVDTSSEAGMELQKILGTGDVVLIKGSQFMRMEKVVEEILRHPEDAKKILVRQEPEWLSRS